MLKGFYIKRNGEKWRKFESYWGHPPSGFAGYMKFDANNENGVPIFNNSPQAGINDRQFAGSQKINQAYVFSIYLYGLYNGGGYIKYDSNNANYVGNK